MTGGTDVRVRFDSDGYPIAGTFTEVRAPYRGPGCATLTPPYFALCVRIRVVRGAGTRKAR